MSGLASQIFSSRGSISSGGQVPVGELAALNNALRKAADVGYQTAAGTTGGDTGSYAPLVPQSIDSVLSSATYTMKHLQLWKRIPKADVSQTLHEYIVEQEHGADLDPFFAEGGVPGTNRSEDERKSVRIKYLAERREVTDVAAMVGIIGVDKNALARETKKGTVRLLAKTERMIFHADSTINPLAFDGIFKQIEDAAPANVTDLEGSAPTPDLLGEMLGEMCADPQFADPDTIYCEPRIHQELIRQAVAHGRHDQLSIKEGTLLTFGVQKLAIQGPLGAVPIVSAPFLYNRRPVPKTVDKTAIRATGVGDTIPTTPTNDVALAAANNAASKFVAADAGNYRYYVEAVGAKGVSAIFSAGQVAVIAGDRVTMTVKGDALAVDPVYYRFYRSRKDGLFSDAEMLWEQAYVAGVDTAFIDDNVTKPGSSKLLAIRHDPSIFQWVQLLDFLRRPLAEVETTKPFLLMLFGAPIVKVPSKCWVIKNARPNSAGLIA